MDFIDEVRALASRIPKQLQHLQTEEATKNALVMPLINALGYNVFDPTEVVPEFTADVGTKKSEKVDYAIIKDGKPIMLFECKAAGTNLDDEHASQLFRYFTVTEARFGVLTNGVVYRFYSDLDERNKMDLKPFLEVNMLELNEALIEELKRFTNSSFELESTLEAASELKYTKEIKRILSQQLREPTDDFVRLFASQVGSRRMTQSVLQQFAELTKRALNQFINDRISDRLRSAMATEGEPRSEHEGPPAGDSIPSGSTSAQQAPEINTTEQETEAYYVIKAILRDVTDVKRLTMRNLAGVGNSAILLDDNQRKPICRLWFRGSRKYLGLIDEKRQEERVSIEEIDDVYNYADRLKVAVSYYDQQPQAAASDAE